MSKKAKSRDLVITPKQYSLDLQIAAEREVDGVGMGVLSDGTPFLTVRGLARLCGVDSATVVRITAAWQETPLKPRERKIRELIREQGVDDSIAFIATQKNGTIYHAVPSSVCMAVLEYYAFDRKSESRDHALQSYRTLARKGFTDFVYAQVGYNPTGSADLAWLQFQDRVSLTYDTVPDGYFSVFKEIADMFVTLIRGGANVGTKFLPDISVGQHWSKFWQSENLDVIYGVRIKYDNNYPQYFPQAASNPQPSYCYPNDALGEFRKWIKAEYIQKKMPAYLKQKTKDGQISSDTAQKAIAAFAPKALPKKG